ncbi:Endoribonuclease VapD 2 (plasmid) [Bergeyella porcorum]|uniref:Endoribonuclease VapD 2 n=2 Tax=Bergeyella porcorum TaxID=1735111 RepID=A0AAU0F732_9FLAO
MFFYKKMIMYAILFDLDINSLSGDYEDEIYHNAYQLVKEFMIENGFKWKQGSVYFGDDSIDAVACVLAVQGLARKYPWFSTYVKDVRMLRIEEDNDLFPAILF